MNILITTNKVLPAVRYGGTERVVWSLAKELSAMHHHVTLLAPAPTESDFCRVIHYNPKESINSQIPDDIDFVHFNYFDGKEISKPCLETIHGLGGEYENPGHNLVFVSRSHAARFGSDQYVYNGLDWSDYATPDLALPRSGYHFLGNGAWKAKNLRGAINLVKSIPGEKLEVLGARRINFSMGFRCTLSPKIHFHGMVANDQKKQFIEKSRGLLFLIKWSEPFGLCVTESLYFGSPVFTTPYGSMPELITRDVGYITDNAKDLREHLASCSYSPKICHEYAADNFNSRKMAEEYLKKYELILNGKKLNPPNMHRFTGHINCIWNEE